MRWRDRDSRPRPGIGSHPTSGGSSLRTVHPASPPVESFKGGSWFRSATIEGDARFAERVTFDAPFVSQFSTVADRSVREKARYAFTPLQSIPPCAVWWHGAGTGRRRSSAAYELPDRHGIRSVVCAR